MAGDVSITRAIGFRNDALNTTNWAALTGVAPGLPSASISTDGDIMTLSVTFTNNDINDYGSAQYSLTAGGETVSSTTYPKIMTRQKNMITSTSVDLKLRVIYSDLTSDAFTLIKNTSFKAESFTLTAGKTVNNVEIAIIQNVTGPFSGGPFTVDLDFIFIFKETLTLPAVSQPLQLTLPRTLVELPIPSREGGVLQDIGSDSARLDVAGALVTTSSPNNYTGEQWWDVLVGAWLEGNWQWLSSDRVNYKYQIEELTVRQDPGKVGYYEFKMRLKKVDILSATAQTYGAIQ